jgi:aldose 1-epimerase
MTDDNEFALYAGDWSATVSALGASLRGVACRGEPVVTGYRGTANKQGGQGDVLIPFPGRVAGGRYTWDGIEHQLPLTDKDGPNAIHGFVRSLLWTVQSRSHQSVAFALDFEGAPGYRFPLALQVAYHLTPRGLRVESSITSTGSHDAPVAMGFHPYFTVGSPVVNTDRLLLPFRHVLEFDRLIPTGRVLAVHDAGLDFTHSRVVGDTVFNHCFAAPVRDTDGLVRVRFGNGIRELVIWMDEAFDHVVVYTGDALAPSLRRASIAIEPMSSATDALNHPEWGLHRLAPKATLRGAWGVELGQPAL